MFSAAETLGPEAENRVRQALLDEFMETSYSDSEYEGYSNEEHNQDN